MIKKEDQIQKFKDFIWDFYKENRRDLPWRNTSDPYKIVVSEIMLQQTQVPRVMVKYNEFIDIFPDFQSLANASFQEVLQVWQGMGYNRRAKYLKEIASKVIQEFGGVLPDDPEILVTFPGIGKNTAGSIVAFAFNKPTVFIETNIRRVFIHHFFSFDSAQDEQKIDDKEIKLLVEQTVDNDNPKDWYYALMDYGTWLAKTVENPNKKSKHYVVQSKFEGSVRQIRGGVLKQLLIKSMTADELSIVLDKELIKTSSVLDSLKKEGLIKEKKGTYKIG